MPFIEKVRVWRNPDGSVQVTRFEMKELRPGETEDQLIERSVATLKRDFPIYQTLDFHDKREPDLPNKKDRQRWRIKQNGDFFIDKDVELPSEAREKIIKSAKVKLKSGQPLNDEEVEALFKDI